MEDKLKIFKLLLPITLLLLLAACSMNTLPQEKQIYDSKTLLKHCDESLGYNDLVAKTDIIIQSDNEHISESYLTYIDTILTKKISDSEIKEISINTSDDLIRIDNTNSRINELKQRYSLSGEYLILITPKESFNYHDFQKYLYFDDGSRRPIQPFIDKNIVYADSVKSARIDTFESTRIITKVEIIQLQSLEVLLSLEIIDNEFYTTYANSATIFSTPEIISTDSNIRRIMYLFRDDLMNIILYLKHDDKRRNQINKIAEEELTEYDEIFDILRYLNIKISDGRFEYEISNGKKSMHIPKEEGFTGHNSSNREQLKELMLSNMFYPSKYDSGYEIPEDKKRPIILSIEKDKPDPTLSNTQR